MEPRCPSSSPGMPRWDLLVGPVVHGAIRALGYLNGERGFLVKGYDDSALAFFNLDGESISHDPGWFSVLQKLGEYVPGDMDAFWALVMQV